jgi:GNAT superfamily N-acetyltransferase
MVSIRPICFPDDIEGILSLDTSFEADKIFNVEITDSSFNLVETNATITKRYSLQCDELARLSALHYGIVAALGSEIVGLAAAEFADWNRRVILHHLYVARGHRNCGIGRLLLQSVTNWSHTTSARCIWLETQNLNLQAIHFYRHAGFSLCGFDESLYDSGKADPVEIGLFFSKQLS